MNPLTTTFSSTMDGVTADHPLFAPIELLGTFAFATSGALAAREQRFDWFGLFAVAYLTHAEAVSCEISAWAPCRPPAIFGLALLRMYCLRLGRDDFGYGRGSIASSAR